MAAGLLGGCAKQRTAENAPQAVLRISQRNEPADLDPATASLPDEFFIIRAVSEGLLVPNPNGGSPLPAAADGYEVSADGLTYTFHLHPGATWSNGEPVTADDFTTSFRRVLTPATASPKAHLLFAVKNARAFFTGSVKEFSQVGFRVLDPLTLVVTLEHPDPTFPLYAASGAWIPVNPRVIAKFGNAWTTPTNHVGNGPFILSEWRPQQRIVVRRNPRYHGAAGIKLDGIEFARFDNKDSEERAYRSGQIDVTMAVPEAKLDAYAHDRAAELHTAPLAETRFLAFNLARKPLDDVRVRRALSLAIDRRKLVDLVLHGGQEPAERFLSPALIEPDRGRGRSLPRQARDGELVEAASGPEFQYANGKAESKPSTAARHEAGPYPESVLHRYDPDAARRLLADAGFPGGRGFPRLELTGWDRNPVLEAMQQMWKQELGVEIGVGIREAKVHIAGLHAGDYDLAFATTLLDVRDATSALADFASDAPNNFPHWKSTDFDRLLALAERAASLSEARVHDNDAEALLLIDAPVAPLYFNAQNWLMSPRVHGWEQDALWTRRYNDVWLER